MTITFTRSGGGMPALRTVVRDAVLDADDERAWMGTEPPHARRRHPHERIDPVLYRVEFRRGSERRVVEMREDDRTAQLAPLIDRLIALAEAGR